jgi:serine/threonine protein kinase
MQALAAGAGASTGAGEHVLLDLNLPGESNGAGNGHGPGSLPTVSGSKRALPASLTYNGASPLKRENFVNEFLGSSTFGQMKLDSDGGAVGGGIGAGSEAELDGSGESARGATNARKAGDADFKRLIVLGHGTFARVVLVQSLIPSDKAGLFAMKILQKKLIIAKKQTSHTMTERSVLGRCSSHPFLVSLRYAFQTPETLNLVIDFCAGGELYYHLSRLGRFPESRACFYAAELTMALEHLHSFNVIYRDLKPENVLIAGDGHIMLADFGLSKEGIRDPTNGTDTFCGTPEYLAPEILGRVSHGKAVDWWSLGILLFEMLYGLPPWYSKNRRTMFEGICHRALDFPAGDPVTPTGAADALVSPVAKQLMRALLIKNPRSRLGSGDAGAHEVRGHAFFASVDFAQLLLKEGAVPWKPEQGKIYFDPEYTKMPCDPPPTSKPKSGVAVLLHQPTSGGEASPGLKPVDTAAQIDLSSEGTMIAASPLLPSSFVERAFRGFSYTDPVSAAAFASPQGGSPERARTHSAAARLKPALEEPDDELEATHEPKQQPVSVTQPEQQQQQLQRQADKHDGLQQPLALHQQANAHTPAQPTVPELTQHITAPQQPTLPPSPPPQQQQQQDQQVQNKPTGQQQQQQQQQKQQQQHNKQSKPPQNKNRNPLAPAPQPPQHHDDDDEGQFNLDL